MTGGEFATRGSSRCLRRGDREAEVALLHDSRAGRIRQRHVERRQLENRRRPDLADRHLRSRLNLVYWAVGNPAPAFDRVAARRDGQPVQQLGRRARPDTGTLKWHYQFTPDDGHDWDSVQDMVLVDRVWRGQPRKLLMHADRNGHFYVLDRTNGKFLSGTPFVYQNWNTGFDANGRPQPVPGSNSSREGQLPRLSDARRRHEFPGAFLQPGHGLVLSRVRRRRAAVRQRAAAS